jgi:hypothetical protein
MIPKYDDLQIKFRAYFSGLFLDFDDVLKEERGLETRQVRQQPRGGQALRELRSDLALRLLVEAAVRESEVGLSATLEQRREIGDN